MVKNALVVGLGSIALRHRKNIKFLYPNSTVYALSSSGRTITSEVEYCDAVLADLKSFDLSSIDLAVVASPATFHAKHTSMMLESSVPTLVEKPLSESVDNALKIIEMAKGSPNMVAVGYCLRFLPSFQRFQKLLQANKVGKIQSVFIEVGQYLPDWRNDKNYKNSVSASKELGGGALLELSHEIDYAFSLFGKLEHQYGCLQASSELGLEVEDCVDLIATTKEHVPVHVHLDFLQKKPSRFCKIIGSKGVMQLDFINNEITFTDSQLTEKLFSEPNWDKNLMYVNMLQHFLSLDEGGDSPLATIEESMQVVQFIEYVKNRCVLIKR